MKKMLFSMFILISIPCNAQIPKKANTIIITINGTSEEYFNKISSILLENGYGIQSSDKTIASITTSEKPFKNGAIKLVLLLKDQKVLLRGQFSVDLSLGAGNSSADWMEIQYLGMNNSPFKNAWNEMNVISQAIPGEKQYLVK
jgi:hypothetical protein